jgi:hypothetical protein
MMTQRLSYRRMLARMGYYNYQNGLIYRHLNQKGGWDHHQELCRGFIIKALDYFNPEKVTVLGSGWLLDLPFTEIVERTRKVCLIDIIHPPDVITQSVNLKNVELIEQDITGGLIEELWQDRHKYSFFNRLKSIKKYNVPEYKPADDPGMVISLNVLTQLEAMLVRFLKRRSGINEEEFNQFRAEIQKNHIDFLNKHESVLITDYSEVITDKSGNVKSVPTLLTELPQSHLKEEWIWDFDQTGADLYNSRSQFKMVALIF